MEKWTRLLVVLATLLLLVLFLALALRLGMFVHQTLLLFALGGLIAYALDPMVEALGRLSLRGRPSSREMRVVLVLGGLVVVLGLASWSLGGHVVTQVENFRRDYPTYSARGRELAGKVDAYLAGRGLRVSVVETIENPPPEVTRFLASLGREALPVVGTFLANLGESAMVLIIAIHFLIFGPELRARFNASIREEHRHRAELWQTDVDRILGGFVRGQLLLALLTGVMAAAGCLVTGIKTWLLIGLFVAVTALIPVFGLVIGAIPAVIAAVIGPTYLNNALAAAAVVGVLFVVINEVASKIFYPRFVGRALGLHTVLVLFVLLAGLEVGGIAGVLFAAPATALAIATAVHLYRLWLDLPDSLLFAAPASVPDPAPEEA